MQYKTIKPSQMREVISLKENEKQYEYCSTNYSFYYITPTVRLLMFTIVRFEILSSNKNIFPSQCFS